MTGLQDGTASAAGTVEGGPNSSGPSSDPSSGPSCPCHRPSSRMACLCPSTWSSCRPDPAKGSGLLDRGRSLHSLMDSLEQPNLIRPPAWWDRSSLGRGSSERCSLSESQAVHCEGLLPPSMGASSPVWLLLLAASLWPEPIAGGLELLATTVRLGCERVESATASGRPYLRSVLDPVPYEASGVCPAKHCPPS